MFRRVSMAAAVISTAAAFTFSGTALAQDRDCADFSSQQEAQDAFGARTGDPERLDADDDGIACEALNGGDGAAAEDGSMTQAPAAEGDEDSGTAPTGGVEAGYGGAAENDSNAALPLGLTGIGLLAVGGALAARRGAGSAE